MLRKILMSTVVIFGAMGAASAADLPSTKAPPAYIPPPPLFTWTGVYVGGQVGYMWGNTNPYGYTPNGVVGGAHVGYNYQMGQFVAGLEGDINGSSYNGSAVTGLGNFGARENIDGSVRGRLGVAWDRALIYATGGAAFAGLTDSYPGASYSHTRVGWTLGGGVEYAIDNNWSVRAEYRYSDYGTYYDFPALVPAGVYNHTTDNRVQVGFSYKFDMFAPPGPVVAKY
ncbi:MAG: outer membrane protein [Methylovirgula sp.]